VAEVHRRLSASILVALLGNAFAPLASIATAPILAQALGVDGRGTVAAATAPLLLASAVATFGVPAAVTYTTARFPAVARRLAGRGALVLLATGSAVSAAIVAASGFFAGGDPAVRNLVVLAAAALVPTLLVALLQAVASGLHRWRLVTLERAITAAVRLGALLVLMLLGRLDVVAAVVVLAVAPVLGAVAYTSLFRVRGAPAPSASATEQASVGALASYGMRVWVGSISGILLTRLDQSLMTPLSSAAELGLYVVAVNVADLPLVISNAVRDVTFSSHAADSDDARLYTASRLSSAVTVGVAGALAATTWWWLPIVFGADFAAALPACLLLLLATALGAQGGLAGTALSARGRPGRRSASMIVACVVNAALLVVLVPLFGAVGAAIGTCAGNLTSSTLNVLGARRLLGMPARGFYGLRRSDLVVLRSVAVRLLRRAR